MSTSAETPSAFENVPINPFEAVSEQEWLSYQGKVVAIDTKNMTGIVLAADGSPIVGDSYDEVNTLLKRENALRGESLQTTLLAVPHREDVEILLQTRESASEVFFA